MDVIPRRAAIEECQYSTCGRPCKASSTGAGNALCLRRLKMLECSAWPVEMLRGEEHVDGRVHNSCG